MNLKSVNNISVWVEEEPLCINAHISSHTSVSDALINSYIAIGGKRPFKQILSHLYSEFNRCIWTHVLRHIQLLLKHGHRPSRLIVSILFDNLPSIFLLVLDAWIIMKTEPMNSMENCRIQQECLVPLSVSLQKLSFYLLLPFNII